jgi:photosystem II stability/assembly factor-like uncharacterized protein
METLLMGSKPAPPRPSATRAQGRLADTPRARGLPRSLLIGGFLVVLVALVVAGLVMRGGARSSSGAIATLQTADFHALAFSPDDPNVVFFGHHNGIMRSDDGGHTWISLVDRPNFDAMGLAISRTNGRQVYLAGHNVFQVSSDGGASWQPVSHNLPGTDIHGFAMSPDNSNRLYAFVVGNGILQSDDGGRTWQMLSDKVPGDIMGMAAAGGTPETLYAGSMRFGILRSTDGGHSWNPAMQSVGSTSLFALAVDPQNHQTVYAGGENGLLKTTDGGTTWRKLPFPADAVVAVTVSPSQPSVVLAISIQGQQGLLYRSEDGGQSWGARQ